MSEKQKQPGQAQKIRAEQHFQRGRELWKAGDKAMAITEYNAAIALDPESPAAVALDMATRIMDFYDKQRYNP